VKVVAIVLACVTCFGGCSFLFVHEYSEPPPGFVTDCTASYTSPIADAAITALAAAGCDEP
jgi:hypothetical protein